MKSIFQRLLMLLLLSAMLAGCYVRPEGSVVLRDGPVTVGVHFSDADRRHVHGYYEERYRHRHKGKRLPPGLAKRKHLPPGLAKRDRLPPGLSGERLPHELERRLSPLPEGVIRLRIGTDLILMDQQSRVVIDVIKDIPLY